MKNLKAILEQNLTQKEEAVVRFLFDALKYWIFNEEFSDVIVEDIAQGIGFPIGSVKGVVGSLCKKKILDTYREGRYDLVLFHDQDFNEDDI